MERRGVIIAILAVLGIGLLIWGINSTRNKGTVPQKEQPNTAISKQVNEESTNSEN
jgi:hypothetical protein